MFGKYLLCMLRHHENEREVVHSERGIEQSVCINEENDVLDSILDKLRVAFCKTPSERASWLTHSLHEDLTSETEEKREARLVVSWALHDMRSQYRVDIFLEISLLQLGTNAV